MSQTNNRSITMVVTNIYGTSVEDTGVCEPFGGNAYEGSLPKVDRAIIRCENGPDHLSFETAAPSDFWVGQEIRVDITFQPRWSQK